MTKFNVGDRVIVNGNGGTYVDMVGTVTTLPDDSTDLYNVRVDEHCDPLSFKTIFPYESEIAFYNGPPFNIGDRVEIVAYDMDGDFVVSPIGKRGTVVKSKMKDPTSTDAIAYSFYQVLLDLPLVERYDDTYAIVFYALLLPHEINHV